MQIRFSSIGAIGVYVPFMESAFDSQYKRKDPDLLKRISGFIDTYFNENYS